MTRTSRIFELRRALLRQDQILDAAGWAAEFRVDARTILRDIEYLKQHEGLEITYDPRRKGYRTRRKNTVAMRETKDSKWARLLGLIHRIAAEPGLTNKQLADATGRSARTIFRDLEELQNVGIPLYNDNGYRFAADAFLPAFNLQPGEVFALVLGVRLLEAQDSDELGDNARRALEKLTRATPEPKRQHLGEIRGALHVAEPSEDTGISMLLELQAVIGNGKQIRILYQGVKDSSAQWRTVDPMGLFGFRQVWYLRVFDLLRSDHRSFRLSRILDWEALESDVSQPARMELDDAVYHRWNVDGQPVHQVELKVSESLGRWLAENPPHPSQTLDGDRATYQITDLPAVARWVASLYGLEVVGPPELRQQMSQMAQQMAQLYA